MDFDRIADKKRTDFIVRSVRADCAPGADVLDIGCGNGIISRALAENGFRVTAIDNSEKTIAAAITNNSHPNLTYKVIADTDLQPDLGAYDAVICSEVLEHLHHPENLLLTINSLLKDKGILVVTVPNGRGPRELFVTRPVQAIESGRITGRLLRAVKRSMGYTGTTVQSSADDLRHVQFFTLGKLKRLASFSGFRIEKTVASNFIEQVFPFSLLYRKSRALQRFDCRLADKLPLAFTSGFMSIWKKD